MSSLPPSCRPGTTPTKSLLTSTLQSIEGERHKLLNARDYSAAKALRHDAFKTVEKLKHKEIRQLAKSHELENDKLQRASEIAISRLDSECDEKVTYTEKEWNAKLAHLEHKHMKERQELEVELWRKESQKRNIHSSYVRDLQMAEKKLADLHMYDECEMTRTKIEKKEQEELAEMEAAKEKRVQLGLKRLEAKQEAERKFLLTRMRNALVIARTQSDQKKTVNYNRFLNKDLQMQHAHATEKNMKVNLSEYVRPKWIKLPERDRQAATSRGSQVFLQQVGDKYSIPSLCDLYGDKTQEELCPPISSARKKILLY